MRYEETCSCGAALVVIDEDSRYDARGQANQRVEKRIKDWRRGPKHETATTPTPTPKADQ